MSRLDKNRDGLISRDEWVSFLGELFQFMNLDAFDKHCQELFATLSKADKAAAAPAATAAAATPRAQAV
jgi:hypothetical protein